MTRQNWVHAKPWHQKGTSLHVSFPAGPTICWEAHTTWAICPLIFAFLHGCWRRRYQRPGWAPTVLHSQDEECVCVCVAEVREVPLACVLWAFSCFLLWSSFSSLHPTRSLCLRLLVCSTLTVGIGGRAWEGVTASHRDTACSVNTERGAGRAANGAQPPGAECSGRRVHQELKWWILYSSVPLFYALWDPSAVGWNSCVKNNCHSA